MQRAAAGSPASTADQLAKLAGLRDRGVISAGEFEREKAKVLAASPASAPMPVRAGRPRVSRDSPVGRPGPDHPFTRGSLIWKR